MILTRTRDRIQPTPRRSFLFRQFAFLNWKFVSAFLPMRPNGKKRMLASLVHHQPFTLACHYFISTSQLLGTRIAVSSHPPGTHIATTYNQHQNHIAAASQSPILTSHYSKNRRDIV